MTNKEQEKRRLVDLYLEHLVASEQNLREGGDYIIGNEHVDAYIAARDELFANFGDEGREAIVHLLDDKNPSVRMNTANALLRYKHEKAMSVLKDLATRYELGLTCAGAQATIARWEDGVWDLDPDPSDLGKTKGDPNGASHSGI